MGYLGERRGGWAEGGRLRTMDGSQSREVYRPNELVRFVEISRLGVGQPYGRHGTAS